MESTFDVTLNVHYVWYVLHDNVHDNVRETSLRLAAVPRLAYTSTWQQGSQGTRAEAWLGLGGGAVYELLVGLREEDKTK